MNYPSTFTGGEKRKSLHELSVYFSPFTGSEKRKSLHELSYIQLKSLHEFSYMMNEHILLTATWAAQRLAAFLDGDGVSEFVHVPHNSEH